MTRKLLILDCNGVMWTSKKAKEPPRPDLPSTTGQGVHYIDGNIFCERMRLKKFLSLCFEKFDVAIWTCAGKTQTEALVQTIFTEEERSQFKFIWHERYTTNSGILRPDGKRNWTLKNLGTIWDDTHRGVYDDTNTLLIDDSPFKAYPQSEDSHCFIHLPLNFGDFQDTFLIDILWPLLDRLSRAIDVKLFLLVNQPKWSTMNEINDMVINIQVYDQLGKKFHAREPSNPKYTILDVS